MYRNGIVAVEEKGRLIIRQDKLNDVNLIRYLKASAPQAIIIPPKTGGGGSTGSGGSTSQNGCDTVGGTCDGMTVIAVESVSGGSASISYDGLTGFGDNWSSMSAFGGFVGPKYTFQSALNCLEAETTALLKSGRDAANYFISEGVGGLLAIYGTQVGGTNGATALINVSTSLLEGDVSIEVFFMVILAILGSEALADALLACAAGLLIYDMWNTLVCFATGKV